MQIFVFFYIIEQALKLMRFFFFSFARRKS